MSQSQAAQLGAEMAREPKTIQLEVLKRFMDDREINAFLKSYRDNRKRGADRQTSFDQPVTTVEKKMLSAFITETDKSTQALAEQFGMGSPGKYWFTLAKAAIRILYQNRIDLA
ncbi:MAG: hypothetical protein AAB922_07875 [Patescibacteria group bacterium]